MSLWKYVCRHKWPEYFEAPRIGYADGINRHHLSLRRDCIHGCGARDCASVHVPQVYVQALNSAAREEKNDAD